VVQVAIWVRVCRPSLVRMCWTWFSAVRSEMCSAAAICRLVRPRATSAAISPSRRVSGPAAEPSKDEESNRADRSSGIIPSRDATAAAEAASAPASAA
jgi:hypothetical protein